MPSSSTAHQPHARTPAAGQAHHQWLILVHQLPSKPSNLRVRTWRRLQQLGAVPVKQAVYVLPDTPNAREDFEWLKAEIKEAGGDASVFAGDSVDKWSNDALIEEFRRSRQEAYLTLAGDIERVLARARGKRRRSGTRAPALGRLMEGFRQRLGAIERVDFFGSTGRDRVLTVIAELDAAVSTPARRPDATGGASNDAQRYHNRLWVTRRRPGVDRMASAWLIRRFIDRDAKFGFIDDPEAAPSGAIPFDMFGVEFTHRGGACTFETLCASFGLDGPALERVAAVVHDLDLKDARFGSSDAPTIGLLIEGLRLAQADDEILLNQGMEMFEALYRAFEHAERPSGPRVVAPGAGHRRRDRTRSGHKSP